jgi:hypothetical protein
MKAFGKVTDPPASSGLPVSGGSTGSGGTGSLAFGGVSATVTWTASNLFGFDVSSLMLKASKMGILVEPGDQLAGIDAFTLTYSTPGNVPTLEGAANISIPRSSGGAGPKALVIGARLKVVDGSFAGAGFTLDGVNKPLGDTGIFFQGITGNLDVKPVVGFTLGGLFTLLPPINNESIASGTVEVRGFGLAAGCTSGSNPLEIHTNITSSILADRGIGQVLADGSNCAYFDVPGVESSMNWTIRLDAGGIQGVMGATGNLRGLISGNGMDMEGGGSLSVPFVPGTIGANFLVSSTGFAACTQLTSFFSGGFGRSWTDTGPVQTFSGSCDLGPWRVTVTPSVPRRGLLATTAGTFAVPAGLPIEGFEAIGASEPPAVELTGPHGEHFTAPADGHLVKTSDVVIATSAPEHAVFFIVRKPAAGTWRILDLDPGNAATRTASAAGLADPHLKAKVTGSKRRKLTYSLTPRSGLTVRFEDVAGGVTRVIGTPHSARKGSISFSPLIVRTRLHQIRALLSQNGVPLSDRIVTTFKVAPPVKPGRVKIRHVARKGSKLTITFKTPRGATHYLIVVTDAAGQTLRAVTAKSHLVINGLPAKGRLKIQITAENALDVRGPAVTVRVR